MKNYCLAIAALLSFTFSATQAAAQTPAPGAAAAAATPAARSDSPEQSIRNLEDALNTAIQKGDADGLDKLLADEWFVKSNARVVTKPQLIGVLKSNGSPWTSIKDEGVEVRLYESAAVVSGVSVRKLQRGEGDFRFRFTRVYAKGQSGWKLVAMHVDEVR